MWAMTEEMIRALMNDFEKRIGETLLRFEVGSIMFGAKLEALCERLPKEDSDYVNERWKELATEAAISIENIRPALAAKIQEQLDRLADQSRE